jgi:ABC-type arginine transport system ATPase subunit
VSKVLHERGADVRHILSSGEIETHKETMLRVLDLLGMPREDMLNSQDELISQAYQGREKQIAYRREE